MTLLKKEDYCPWGILLAGLRHPDSKQSLSKSEVIYTVVNKLMQSLPAVWPFPNAFRQNFEGWFGSNFSYVVLLWWEEDSQVRRQAHIQQNFKRLRSSEHVNNPIGGNEATLNA